uniref:Ground-like domain-containing protein n=1 Tax=Ditylenchus dipsaci TaxID=166011 RepID=A0A915D0Q2_9BILA
MSLLWKLSLEEEEAGRFLFTKLSQTEAKFNAIYALVMFLDPRFKDRFAVDKVKFNTNVATWIQEECEKNVNVCDATIAVMYILHCLLLIAIAPLTYSFLMGGGGGGGCGCAMPACAPPAPAACPPVPACPCNRARAAARGEKTVVIATKEMDALELQATLMGLDLADQHRPVIVVPKDRSSQASNRRTELEELERLGEELSKSVAITHIDQSTNSKDAIQTSSQDLPHLKSKFGSEVRFSPVKKVDEKLEAQDNATTVKSEVISTTPLVIRVDEESTSPITTTTTPALSTTTAIPIVNGTDQVVDVAESMSAALDGDEGEHGKCNSQVLKKLMIENITDNSNESKKAVNIAAEHQFGGSIDVVCSRGHFSYVYSSSLFCEASKGEVTCIAFRQSN